MENVVLGYKDYGDYETNPNFFGALIGPVAGRIQDATFELNEKTYALEANDGENHLHGGSNGFHQVIWHVEPFETNSSVGLKLSHTRADQEGGYPGNVDVCVIYTLNNANQLMLEYRATSNQATPFTVTNHSYFNLSGNLKNTVHNHHVTMDSGKFIELDEELIPTGQWYRVAGTTFDFRNGGLLQDGFNDKLEQNQIAGSGYDHYFIFDDKQEQNVIVRDSDSGRTLTIQTDQPGMVMYTANTLEEGLELAEGLSKKHLGVCFETQASPASLHHEGFPNVILEGESTYNKRTLFSFGVEN
ncbi:aldose epimerase family protein [Virgibacillus saliphilus]|uniref:aldose epimerase family protein n=1 Tax=Virgibacillus saliphilus TaxID=2831674 RepID=UPI0028151764|nr:aldose epimerase family protein [Virgibacillus sp. NKC19-3]